MIVRRSKSWLAAVKQNIKAYIIPVVAGRVAWMSKISHERARREFAAKEMSKTLIDELRNMHQGLHYAIDALNRRKYDDAQRILLKLDLVMADFIADQDRKLNAEGKQGSEHDLQE